MAVDVKTEDCRAAGLPKVLFQTQVRDAGRTPGQYAMSATGDRFLISESLEAARQSAITILTNWTNSLKR